jgi:hypothetical protein
MIAYKLFRKLKNGSIRSLFINKKVDLPLNTWLEADFHPTKGFKERFGWHCCPSPVAPHLSIKNRAWYQVEMLNYTELVKPASQGGKWYLAGMIKIIKEI